MARKPRSVIAGHPFLLSVRGNNGQAVFTDDEDRRRFKTIVMDAIQAHGVAIHAYVLMVDAFQIIATPEQEQSLALLIQAIGRRYVKGFNRRHGRTGTLWDARFRASLIQDAFLLSCQRYLERAPVRAGLVGRPEHSRWSSHRHHLGLANDPLVSTHTLFWALGNTPFEREVAYRERFEAPDSVTDAWVATQIERGHPVAERTFLDELEARTGKAWRARPVGRPARSVVDGDGAVADAAGGLRFGSGGRRPPARRSNSDLSPLLAGKRAARN